MNANDKKKPDKRKWLKCHACKARKETTSIREDPYSAEINDDHREFPICDDCWQESCDGI
jgi:hypothetical protein